MTGQRVNTEGASLTVPDAQGRYLSVMVVNQDHHIERIFHEPGTFELGVDEFRTPYVMLGARVLVDPNDADDVATVNEIQDGFGLAAPGNEPYVLPDYEPSSLDVTRNALLELARGIEGFDRGFGKRDEVDPVRHIVCAAAGWGGLPEYEAYYVNVEPQRPVGEYRISVADVPVDGFWSLSVYNADGYFEPNDRGAYNVNSITAERDPDGRITLHFGTGDDDKPNYLPITEGWNYMVRLYRPRPEVLDSSWRFPELSEV